MAVVLVLGFSNIFADALSMGVGEYLSSKVKPWGYTICCDIVTLFRPSIAVLGKSDAHLMAMEFARPSACKGD